MLFKGNASQLMQWLTWGETQLEYAFYLVMLFVLIVIAFKRAWILLVTMLMVFAFIAIFVNDPTVLIRLAEWFNYKLKN